MMLSLINVIVLEEFVLNILKNMYPNFSNKKQHPNLLLSNYHCRLLLPLLLLLLPNYPNLLVVQDYVHDVLIQLPHIYILSVIILMVITSGVYNIVVLVQINRQLLQQHQQQVQHLQFNRCFKKMIVYVLNGVRNGSTQELMNILLKRMNTMFSLINVVVLEE